MKTVSLAEALKSGKKFRYRESASDHWCSDYVERNAWTENEILHAECQIIEEPREIWAIKFDDGEWSFYAYPTQEQAISWCNGNGRPVKFREVCDE